MAIATPSLPRDERAGSRPLAWFAVAALIYLLLAAVGAIGEGFKLVTGSGARELFAFATNPMIALIIGIVATALVQSSSTVTSIIVGMVAGGLPLGIAIPMVMGANIGTSLTSTLVSLGHVRDGDDFRRAFAAATVHDCFNIIAVAVLLPLELAFGFLLSGAEYLGTLLLGDANLSMKDANFMKVLLAPAGDLLQLATAWLPTVGAGIALIAIGIGLILYVVTAVGRLLRQLMVGRAKQIMHASVGRGPLSGMFSGGIVTMLVQSSSTTTSLMVPLAGSGVFSLRQVYPFTLGANVGTTITALLAATAISGPTALLALQIALVHLLFNIGAIVIIYGVPLWRDLPVHTAEWLANLAQRNKLYVAAYILGVFFVVPLTVIGVSALL